MATGANIGDVFLRVLADMAGFEADVTKKAGMAGDKAGAKAGQSLGKSMTTKATAAFTAAGAASGALFVGAIGGAANFEDQLRTINTVAHLTDDELKGVGDSILDLSKETGNSTDDLTAGFYDLVSAGVPAEKAIGVLKDSAILAKGALGTTAETVDLLTSALNAYGLEASSSARVSDIFAQAVADGKVTAADLGNTIAQIAPLASSAGVSLEEVAAGYAIMTAKGATAEKSATQMRAAISALLTPNEELIRLQEATGKRFADVAREKGLARALEELRLATKGNNDQFAKALGSIDAYGFALASTGENGAAFAAELDKVTVAADKGGVAQGQYEERMKSAAQQGQKFVAGLRATAIQIAGPFTDSLGGAVIALNELGGGMGGLVNLSRLFGGVIGGTAGFLASKLGPLVKRGFAAAFGRLIIPSALIAGPLEDAASTAVTQATSGGKFKGALSKLASVMGGKFGLAMGAALVVGLAAIAPDIKKALNDMWASVFPDWKPPLAGVGDWLKDLPWPLGPKGAPDWAKFEDDAEEGASGVAEAAERGINRIDLRESTADIPRDVGEVLASGAGTVTAGAETMVDGIPVETGKAKDEAVTIIGQTPTALAAAILEKQGVVGAAAAALKTQMTEELTPAQNAVRTIGFLTSKEFGQGIHDGRSGVRHLAEELRTTGENELRKFIQQGGKIGGNAMDALNKGLKDKNPAVRAEARRIKRIIEEETKKVNAKPAGSKAGRDVVSGLRTQSGPVGTAAFQLGKRVATYVLKGVTFKVNTDVQRGTPVKPRQSGGVAVQGQAYVVGERRAEFFVPETTGRIYPTVQAGMEALGQRGGDTNINLQTYGLPMMATTPLEVAMQVRRVSHGIVQSKRRAGWSGA